MLGEAWLFLVHVDNDDIEFDRRHFLKMQQHIKQGIAVFTARQTHHDLVAFLNHVEVGHCFAREPTQTFLQFVLID